MRAAAVVPALLLALLAQPALGQLPVPDLCVAGPAGAPAAPAPALPARDPDPLVRFERFFLGPDGTLVQPADAPPDAAAGAPTAVPLVLDGTVLWARDFAQAGALRGDAAFVLRLRVCLPSASASAASLEVALLRNGEEAARVDAGPQLLTPGDVALSALLPVDGLALAAGDNLAVAVTLHALNAEPSPSVRYLAGPNGSRLDAAMRYPSLDALGHRHSAADRHDLLASWRPRTGDLGAGLWGVDVRLAAPGAQPLALPVPASASRVLLQMHLDDAPSAPDLLQLQVPGGPTELHQGEVVQREVPRSPAASIRCADCGPGGQPATLASVEDAAPVPTPPGDGTGGQGTALQPTAIDQAPGGIPIGVDAADERDETPWYLVLVVPAAVMLLAGITHVMGGGGTWGERPRRAPPPARSNARPASRR